MDTFSEWLRRPSTSVAGTNWPDLEALPIEQEQIESTVPAECIVDDAEAHDVDLAVKGTHGRRGVDRMLFGTVTEEVVRRAPCLVFTVRSDADVEPAQAVRRIPVPVDFSSASASAVQHAKEIALTYGAEINLLHVIEEPVYPEAYGVEPAGFPTEEVVDRVEVRLGEMTQEDIGYEHVRVKAVIGSPARSLLNYVEQEDLDLIVQSTHGRTGFDHVMVGSVTGRVLRQSPVPVFVTKPDRTSLVPATAEE